MKRRPLLALTMGDPAGIGPEIVVKTVADVAMWENADLAVWGSPDILREAASCFVPGLTIKVVTDEAALATCQFVPGELVCVASEDTFYSGVTFEQIALGEVTAIAGRVAYECVVRAAQAVIGGKVDAIVTAPINKASINLSGINDFCGHTELIAEMCGTQNFAMQQSAGNLRVIFVTTHIPLTQVTSEVTKEKIVRTAKLLVDGIVSEGVENPKIAVAAINPHAGENGYMGREDIDVTEPAVAEIHSQGVDVEGPFPPDTLFIPEVRQRFDGIVCMYHDQGHIPFKMLAFDRGVNSTLGLPIIRTSVDHGTAFNLAWQGKADTGSLKAALKLASVKAMTRLEN